MMTRTPPTVTHILNGEITMLDPFPGPKHAPTGTIAGAEREGEASVNKKLPNGNLSSNDTRSAVSSEIWASIVSNTESSPETVKPRLSSSCLVAADERVTKVATKATSRAKFMTGAG